MAMTLFWLSTFAPIAEPTSAKSLALPVPMMRAMKTPAAPQDDRRPAGKERLGEAAKKIISMPKSAIPNPFSKP